MTLAPILRSLSFNTIWYHNPKQVHQQLPHSYFRYHLDKRKMCVIFRLC